MYFSSIKRFIQLQAYFNIESVFFKRTLNFKQSNFINVNLISFQKLLLFTYRTQWFSTTVLPVGFALCFTTCIDSSLSIFRIKSLSSSQGKPSNISRKSFSYFSSSLFGLFRVNVAANDLPWELRVERLPTMIVFPSTR